MLQNQPLDIDCASAYYENFKGIGLLKASFLFGQIKYISVNPMETLPDPVTIGGIFNLLGFSGYVARTLVENGNNSGLVISSFLKFVDENTDVKVIIENYLGV